MIWEGLLLPRSCPCEQIPTVQWGTVYVEKTSNSYSDTRLTYPVSMAAYAGIAIPNYPRQNESYGPTLTFEYYNDQATIRTYNNINETLLKISWVIIGK